MSLTSAHVKRTIVAAVVLYAAYVLAVIRWAHV
jgi:hypothetical protein